MQPLSRQLNIAVNQIAGRLFPCGFDVADTAPQTLEELIDHIHRTGRMLVWSGASDRTIFACPETNYAFRAWHDFHHWKRLLPFTDAGERSVCVQQVADLTELYGEGDITVSMCRVVYAEVVGQLIHKREFGAFPNDQRAFAEAFLSTGTAGGPF